MESDDWGSIRMASRQAYNYFLQKGYAVDQCPYNRNDALESNKDLEDLFDVLASVKDNNGCSAVFTANTIVANPDFEKIKKSDYQNYYYEPFTETLKKYPEHNMVEALYRDGIKNKIFIPQFHGREHLNVENWMKALQNNKKSANEAFEYNMFTVHVAGVSGCKKEYLNSLGGESLIEINSYNDILHSGMDLFKSIWHYESKSFIAPCYTWPVEVEKELANLGVRYIQGSHVQRVPAKDKPLGFKKKYHYLGQKNSYGQRYLVRNVFFEPSSNPNEDWVNKCMKEINNAFFWRKPAIISSHRVNFIGSINPKNKDLDLKMLNQLLKQVVNKYPDVEFMSSNQLGDLMSL